MLSDKCFKCKKTAGPRKIYFKNDAFKNCEEYNKKSLEDLEDFLCKKCYHKDKSSLKCVCLRGYAQKCKYCESYVNKCTGCYHGYYDQFCKWCL